MRTTLTAFIALAVLANFSQAKTITLKSDKAKAFMKALKDMGAKMETKKDHSFYRVAEVKAQYTPRGFNQAQASFEDRNDSRKTVTAMANKAHVFYTALVKAGLTATKHTNPTETYSVEAKRVECEITTMYVHRHVYTVHACEIETR
jgi:ABC-type uncharacterized transport system substrate-binding protein